MSETPNRRCLVCRHLFIPDPLWHRFCGSACRFAASTMRKSIALAEWRCTYCGDIADSIDHDPPTSTRRRLRDIGLDHEYAFVEVRCCRECNSALGDDGGWTVRERKRFIKRWLMRRYGRLLSMPDWQDDELLELGPNLSTYVACGIVKKQIIERRLKF